MSINLNPSVTATPSQGIIAFPATARRAKDENTAEQAKPPQRAALETAVKDIQAFVMSSRRNIEFSIDDSTHQVVVKVIATESGEVIRQIPSETALKLAQSLSDVGSLLFDEKV